jgi:hypothetical protein
MNELQQIITKLTQAKTAEEIKWRTRAVGFAAGLMAVVTVQRMGLEAMVTMAVACVLTCIVVTKL